MLCSVPRRPEALYGVRPLGGTRHVTVACEGGCSCAGWGAVTAAWYHMLHRNRVSVHLEGVCEGGSKRRRSFGRWAQATPRGSLVPTALQQLSSRDPKRSCESEIWGGRSPFRDPSISLPRIVARAEDYTYAASAWDLSLVQGALSLAPCQILPVRFATWSPRYSRAARPLGV
jgi:hypothetical protein